MAEEGHAAHKPDKKDKKKKNKKKLVKLITALIIVKLIIILVLALVIFHVRSPKLRLRDPLVQTLAAGTPSSPSFDAVFGITVTIKNPNFGRYRFESTPVSFIYQGIIVGQVIVPAGSVGSRSTEEVPVLAAASSRYLAGLAGPAVAAELSAGVVSIYGKAVISGRVEVWGIVKRRKKAEMDCFIVFSIATRNVQRLVCE